MSNQTFTQRYYVDSQYYTENGPVFYEIGGEGTLGGAPGGYLATLAKEKGALLIALEHRFYGESVPDSIPNPMETHNLAKYLTVEQALADLATFTTYYKGVNTKTASAPWVVFGGSYPGALSSWYRITYPDMSIGSLSSSGVVDCIVDFTGFDKQVAEAIGNTCSDGIKRINKAFEKLTSSDEGFKIARDMFHCESDMWKRDFFYMIADSWSMIDQYSAKSTLCSTIADAGPDATDQQLMKTFADLTSSFWGEDFCSQGFYNTEALADPTRWEHNARSWRWQTCYQVSYFNTAPSSGSLRNVDVNLEYHLEQCSKIFGQKMYPQSAAMNAKFGGNTPIGHNIFYSDFSDDPWRRASVDYPVSSDQPYFLSQCDDCGHCKDFHEPSPEDPPQLTQSRTEFESYLNKWLQEAAEKK
jgi:pimeloyl-ACP methyl ester carboxylesterase